MAKIKSSLTNESDKTLSKGGAKPSVNAKLKSAKRGKIQTKSQTTRQKTQAVTGNEKIKVAAGGKKIKSETLSVLTPSGRKDQSFFELVYEVARQIPKGKVTSYGAIAACLGTRLSARMVGWAMNGAHHVNPEVPAHRVVNRNGMLSGRHHFATATRMEELLEKEGTQVVDDTVVNFKEKFWDPVADIL